MQGSNNQPPYIFVRIVSVACVSIAVGIIYLMIWSGVDDATGWIAGSVFASGFLILGIISGLRANNLKHAEDAEIQDVSQVSDETLNKRIAALYNRLNTTLAVTIIASIVITADFHNIEEGLQHDYKGKKQILFFVEVLYDLVGFWPTVVILPVIGCWYTIHLYNKIRLLKSVRDNNSD